MASHSLEQRLFLRVGMVEAGSLSAGALLYVLAPWTSPWNLSLAAILCVPATLLAIRHGLRPLAQFKTIIAEGGEILRPGSPIELVPFLTAVVDARQRLTVIRSRERGYFKSLAHEFGTLLAVMQARVESLPETSGVAEFSQDVDRLSRLLNQLLLRARLRLMDLSLNPVDFAELADEVVQEMSLLAPKYDCTISWHRPESRVLIKGSKLHLQDAMRNLILNALHFTTSGTSIDINLSPEGLLIVRDRGPGIAEEHQADIFQPFWKERDQERNGAGLGLMIVRETALLHNGSVSVANHPDGGAVFALAIPLSIPSMALREARQPIAGLPRWLKPLAVTPTSTEAVIGSDDVIFDHDARGVITSWNPAAERILGYRPAEIVGQPVTLLVPHDRSEDAVVIRERVRQGGSVERFETTLRHREGDPVPVMLSVWPIRDVAGNVLGATSVARDIRDRKKIEAVLRSQVRLLTAITDNAAEAMFMSDADNRVTFMNRAAEKLCGWPFEEVRGQRLHDLVHHHKADGSPFPYEECPLVGVYSSRRPLTDVEDILINRDGAFIDVTFSSAPILVDDKVAGSVLVAHDIRDRKRTEAALQHAQKMKAIGTLTGGMAHDFNNSLAIIIANLDALLQIRTGDREVGELAGSALEAALSGSDLTRRLLAFARRQSLRPERVDVNELVTHTVRLLSRTLGTDIQIRLHLAPGLWPVMADATQLEASLTNLAVNARDAMPRGGLLTISTYNQALDLDYAARHAEVVPGEYVLVEVRDSGTGMDPAILDHIFETVLHDQGTGQRNGSGPQHGLRLREAVGRPRHRNKYSGRRHQFQPVPAAGGRRSAGASRSGAGSALFPRVG